MKEQWINYYDKVRIGALYRTSDRCFTLTDFGGSQVGDFNSLSTDISDLEDLVVTGPNGNLRSARIHDIESAESPSEISFQYTPTTFRVELPLGTSFDASQEGSYPQLVPALCDGAVLRAGSLAFDPNVISSTCLFIHI